MRNERQQQVADTTDSEVLAAICGYMEVETWAPTNRELADLTGFRLTTVHRSLTRLEENGYIERGPHPRQIRLLVEKGE